MTDAQAVVSVEVCTGWTAPDAPRDLDADAIADVPDIGGWLAALDSVGLAEQTQAESCGLVQRLGGHFHAVADACRSMKLTVQVFAGMEASEGSIFAFYSSTVAARA